MKYREFVKSQLKGMIKDMIFMSKYYSKFTREERRLMEMIKYYDVSNKALAKYKLDTRKNFNTKDERCISKIKRNIILAESVNQTCDYYIDRYSYGCLDIMVNHNTYKIYDIENHKGIWGKDFNISEEKKNLIIEFMEAR